MRTTLAVGAGISFLVVGVMALSQQAQQVQPDGNMSPAGNASYNVSVGVFEGVTNSGGQGIVWFGIAAVVLVACGFLAYAAMSGGGR